MLPCLLLADDQVRASFVNYHLDGECFDILIITRFAVENQTSETRMISDGKCSLIIADKSSEIWRRGARVWCEHINHADQTRDNHIIYPTDSLMKIADISINTRKGLHTVGRFHLDNCIVSGKTARVISVASLFRWFFIEMAGNVMSNKSVAIKCTPTITMYTVEACTTRSRDFVPTSWRKCHPPKLTVSGRSLSHSIQRSKQRHSSWLVMKTTITTSSPSSKTTLRWSSTINFTSLNTHPYHRCVSLENFRLQYDMQADKRHRASLDVVMRTTKERSARWTSWVIFTRSSLSFCGIKVAFVVPPPFVFSL